MKAGAKAIAAALAQLTGAMGAVNVSTTVHSGYTTVRITYGTDETLVAAAREFAIGLRRSEYEGSSWLSGRSQGPDGITFEISGPHHPIAKIDATAIVTAVEKLGQVA